MYSESCKNFMGALVSSGVHLEKVYLEAWKFVGAFRNSVGCVRLEIYLNILVGATRSL